ncbi:MAG: 3-dehydroquinate synthase [Actinomycetaceae bacterium]|nr:3-dehydroquinate synthase [Actinomycetaceae bacterium]
MRTVNVSAEHQYQVKIGRGALEEIPASLDRHDYERALIIHPESVTAVAKRVGDILKAARIEPSYLIHPDGEAGKTVDVLEVAWDAAGAAHISRRDLIVGVGGGATTDLAGFVAASWLRGVSVLQVPTTLLGMVDAAVGGKTGINTSFGKNLAGAFHSPIAVIADIDTLDTLPDAEFNAGMGEVIKCGFIRDSTILDVVEHAGPIKKGDPEVIDLVEKAVRVKAEVVSSDLKESGMRELLNYGHTLAHVIEKLENYEIRHGEAVSIGIVYAAHVAQEMGFCKEEWRKIQESTLVKQGLPISWKSDNFDSLIEVMTSDKKVRSSQVRMVLTCGSNHSGVKTVEPEVLHRAAIAMGVVSA